MSEQTNKTDEVSLRLMRVLEHTPAANQRELALRTGMSLGSINYCLKALMSKGLVKMQNFAQSRNKLGYVYVLTPTGMAEKAAITHRFLQRKMDEYEALKAEIEALKSEVEMPVMDRTTKPKHQNCLSANDIVRFEDSYGKAKP